MTRRWLPLAIELAAILGLTLVASAGLAKLARGEEQPSCTTRQIMTSVLSKKFQEVPVAAGISEAGALVEIWATSDGQGWTMTITRPDGQICMVVSGRAWQMPEPGRPI